MEFNQAVKSVLVGVKELYGNDENRWAKGDTAKTAEGRHASPTDPEAVCWCLLGAVSKISQETEAPGALYLAAINAIERIVFPSRVPVYNDYEAKNLDEIQTTLDRAIESIS